MPFYDKAPKRHTPKRDYASEGSWDDEGTHYTGAHAGSRHFGPSANRTEQGDRPQRNASRGFQRAGGNRNDGPKREFGHGERRFEQRGTGRDSRNDERREGRRDFRNDDRREGRRDFRNDDRRNGRRDFRDLAPRQPSYLDNEFRQGPVAPVNSEEVTNPNENLLAGRNPIREALKSGRDIEKLLVQRGELTGSAREIVQMAREAHVPVQEVDKVRLDELAPHHQGMLAYASAYQYSTVAAMLEEAASKNEAPFLVLLDGVTDPHNLGAIIRTAECVGAHGVIVPERRSVGLTPAAVKASAGAIEHMKVARVTNLNRTLEELKRNNIWAYAMTMDGTDYEKVNFKGGVALVVGSEGEGISRLTLENCDMKVTLPMAGELDSLNASVAAGVMMYRVLSSRKA